MMKWRKVLSFLLGLALALLSVVLVLTLERGRGSAQPSQLETLNPGGEFVGPEGIQFDAAGNLYVGDAQGRIWVVQDGGRPSIFADLHNLGAEAGGKRIRSGGMAFDKTGNLYVAAFDFAGGSVLRVDAGTRAVRLVARDLGFPNDVVIDSERRHLWVSDHRSGGRLLRCTLAGALPVQPDFAVTGLSYPNGLAFGPEDRSLFVAETYSGNIVRVEFSVVGPQVERVINLKGSFAVGSLDGLAFDPRDRGRRYLYAAENLRGLITVVDTQTQPIHIVKRIRLALMGGRPCPASMVIRGGFLYFTSLWSCNVPRIVLGIPKWGQHAYRFRVTNLTAVY